MKGPVWGSVVGLTLSAGLLLVQPTCSWGADPEVALDNHAEVVNRAAMTPQGEERVVARLSRELNVPAATLRAQRAQFRVGWGELVIANRLSQTTNVPVATLLGQHQSGMGWGAIARAQGLKVGALVNDVDRVAKAVEKAERAAEKAAGKAAKAADKAEAKAEKAADKAQGRAEKTDGGSGEKGGGGGKGGGEGGGGAGKGN